MLAAASRFCHLGGSHRFSNNHITENLRLEKWESRRRDVLVPPLQRAEKLTRVVRTSRGRLSSLGPTVYQTVQQVVKANLEFRQISQDIYPRKGRTATLKVFTVIPNVLAIATQNLCIPEQKSEGG